MTKTGLFALLTLLTYWGLGKANISLAVGGYNPTGFEPVTKEQMERVLNLGDRGFIGALRCSLQQRLPGWNRERGQPNKSVYWQYSSEFKNVSDRLIPKVHKVTYVLNKDELFAGDRKTVPEEEVWKGCRLMVESGVLTLPSGDPVALRQDYMNKTTPEERLKKYNDRRQEIEERTSRGERVYELMIDLAFRRPHPEAVVVVDGKRVAPLYRTESLLISQDEMEKGKGKALFEHAKPYLEELDTMKRVSIYKWENTIKWK